MPSATKRLHDAASRGELHRMQQILSGSKANVNAKNNGGVAAVHVASAKGHTAALEMLAAHGADMNAKAEAGRTALHFASSNGHSGAVALLVKNGADVNATDNMGDSPIYVASKNGYINALKALLAGNGADVNAKNNGGVAAVHVASEKGHTAALEMLAAHGADMNAKVEAGRAKVNDGRTALHYASSNGHSCAVTVLVKKGADVNATDNMGDSPIHVAAKNCRIGVLKALLAGAGADVNAKSFAGWTALHVAAESCHTDVLKVLLEAGANANAKSNHGYTALHIAMRCGETDPLTVLLAARGIDVNANDNDRESPVHVGAEHGNSDALKVLLAAPWVNVNAMSDRGWTALQVAATRSAAALKVLVSARGADVNAMDILGTPPIYLAAEYGRVDALKVLLAAGADVNAKTVSFDRSTALHIAVENGHTAAVELLLEAGADVNAVDILGTPPICLAAEYDRTDALKLLIAADGADVNAKANDKWTALLIAAHHGHTAAVKVLLEAGADVSTMIITGESPICVAAGKGRTDALKVLIEARADVNARNIDGWTALHIAADKGHAHALKVLLEAGADVNANSYQGWTALHLAADKGHARALKVLLAASGVDVNAKDVNGESPIYAAAEYGRIDALKVLLRVSDVDVNAADHDGLTPVRVAAKHGYTDVLRALVENGVEVDANTVSAAESHPSASSYLAEVAKQTLPALRKKLSNTESQLETVAQQLEEARGSPQHAKGKAGEAEASLVALFVEVSAVMDGSDGWASPVADLAGETQQAIEVFVEARELLSMSSTTADCVATAQRRSACCAAATALLKQLGPEIAANGNPAVIPRPPESFVRELSEAVSAAKHSRTAALAVVQNATSTNHDRATIAEIMKAATAADAACAPHIDVVQAKLSAARAAAVSAVCAPALSAGESKRLRSVAEAVLEEEGPWAGDVGLQRRAAAIANVRELVTRRAAAQRAFGRKAKVLAAAKATLAVFSDDEDDDGSVEAAQAALQKAEAERAAALPAMLAATAAVQEWATSGEGALALKAFPGDAELTAALAELFEAEFTAHTELPRTPGVRLDVEYPGGLVESPATLVFYAERVSGDRTLPVVLRRLRLSSPELVQEAQRQVRDAGRIAVGLQLCPDAAAGPPLVVKATRWFLATASGSGTADAWLEFPRAEFGSLAQVITTGRVFSATAAAGLCMRLARAVAQLHAAGIRHGDLNPSNIVLWDDPGSDVVRPGIIDLLDTAVVGVTRTLRGATLEWLPPEAAEAVATGTKGRICETVLAVVAHPDQLLPVRAAAAALCVAQPAERSTAATALLAMEAAVAGASAAAMETSASLQWALPPAQWLCQRGAAPGVDFVALDGATDAVAVALAACAAGVGRRVRAVYRLENLRLWHVYAAERARVAEEAQAQAEGLQAQWPQRLVSEVTQTFSHAAGDERAALLTGQQSLLRDSSPGEALLLHGALKQSHRLIAEGGLDPSYSGGRVGALFGAATCLTPSWGKAANDYAKGAGAGVFVTRAAVGRVADCQKTPHQETSQYRRPPDGHHSVLGDNGSPGAVVAVYRPSQMYPEYLVVFDN